eukprot:gene20332-50408_t
MAVLGSHATQKVVAWAGDGGTDNINRAIDDLNCGLVHQLGSELIPGGRHFCQEHDATNLHGALLWAKDHVDARARTVQGTGLAYVEKFVVVFMSGRDQAGRVAGGDDLAQRLHPPSAFGSNGVRSDPLDQLSPAELSTLAGDLPNQVFSTPQAWGGVEDLFDRAAGAATAFVAQRLPLPFATFDQWHDSKLRLRFDAVCDDGQRGGGEPNSRPPRRDGTPIDGLSFSSCGDLSSLTVKEEGGVDRTGARRGFVGGLSAGESRARITCVESPCDQRGGANSKYRHTMSVHAFDADFGCGGNFCRDPATNLYGAVQEANDQVQHMRLTRFQAFIVVFSDGTDTAARVSSPFYSPGRTSFLDSPAGGAARLLTDWGRQGAELGRRLTYCSPKRYGKVRVRVQLRHQVRDVYWEREFDAGVFDCSGGKCDVCHVSRAIQTKSCARQPSATDQLFVCEGDQSPVYTTSSNSRVSMEFNAHCGNGNPIPGLRFSPCPELSDFHLLESFGSDGWRNVSLWESMPRVVCTPDVISILLLDTSGSFLDAIDEAIGVRHRIAVYVFDGRRVIDRVIDFTDNIPAVKAAMQGHHPHPHQVCVGVTNLNGAVIDVEGRLRQEVRRLQQTDQHVGGEVIAAFQPYIGRRYRVDYCSPKREGRRRTRLVLRYGGEQTWWENEEEFDAGRFVCDDRSGPRLYGTGQLYGSNRGYRDACRDCLIDRGLYSCARQPRGNPVVVDDGGRK